MGILADAKSEDVEALGWVMETALLAWEEYLRQTNKARPYDVAIQDDLLGPLSDCGDKILKECFPKPTPFDRVATLAVLATNSCVFAITKDGKPETNLCARKVFNSRLTCALISAALTFYQPQEAGMNGYYTFAGFGNEAGLTRFLTFLQLLEIDDLNDFQAKDNKARQRRAVKTLARDIISTVNFLEPGIRFTPGSGPKMLDVPFD